MKTENIDYSYNLKDFPTLTKYKKMNFQDGLKIK